MKALIGAVMILTMVASLGSVALPALASTSSGTPFVEVQPHEVEPEGAPSGLALTAPDPTVPPDPFDVVDADGDGVADAIDGDIGDDGDGGGDGAVDEADPDEEAEADPEAEPEAEEEPPEEPPANDLTDIPEYPVPAGFEVLDTWTSGDHVRGTVYAAPDADPAALLVYLAGSRGGWTPVDISDVNGVDETRQWLFEQAEHPFCLWIEYYEKGLEREELEAASGLVGPQFLVVETPFCEGLESPYA